MKSVRRRKQRELNTLHGIPNRIPPDRAIAHITALRRTMGWVHIAQATGCSGAYLRLIARGEVPTINRVTLNKILSAKPAPTPSAGLYIDATGTRRRIHALAAIGYSQARIATEVGTTQHRIGVISTGAARVRQHSADRIAAAYERLAHQPLPVDKFTTRCRNHAAAQGWKDPAFWEDVDRIDDPTFDPDATQLRIEQIAEDARFLLATGLDINAVADRLGIKRDYATKALRACPEQVAA